MGLMTGEVDYQGARLPLRASLGLATFPQDGDRADDLLRVADARMYQAKKNA
jgi:GGDEF domain-containing protein